MNATNNILRNCSGIYFSWLSGMLYGGVNLAADQLAAMLVGTDYQVDFAAHQRRMDVARFEVKGGDYKPGGQKTSAKVHYSERGLGIELAEVCFENARFSTPIGLITYIDNGHPSQDVLLHYGAFSVPLALGGGGSLTIKSETIYFGGKSRDTEQT